MTFPAVKPEERGTLILIGIVFALIVVWLTSYMISAWKRGAIEAPISRWPIPGRSSVIKTFLRADAPFTFWIIYFVHFMVDAVLLAGLLIIIYRFCL